MKTFESIEASRGAIIATCVLDRLEEVRRGKEFIKESQFYKKKKIELIKLLELLNENRRIKKWFLSWRNYHSWDNEKINSSNQEIFPGVCYRYTG